MGIGMMARVHAIGYMLEPVKVRFRKGVRINLLDVRLDAAEDESRMVPRWLARILHTNGMVEVQEQDMGIELVRALSRERIAGEQLTSLKGDFYISLKEFISRQQGQSRDRLMVSLHDVITLRLKKMMDYSRLMGADTMAEVEQRLSVEERVLFRSLHDAVREFREYLLDGDEVKGPGLGGERDAQR
ncbi:MAG: DNA replication complex GINS family protein [Candidatus Nitrosocaldus sp.]|nr:DNA replication complex GINS family protein [Candidatus Nitrosocaldus sp.]MDW8000971.1 hypothetical protein [Candidatus Nitrosocaldus sp.]